MSAVLLANGDVRVKRTRHGLMAYNINDIYIGRSLDCYGEFSRGETDLFAQLIRPDWVALDVGANIGVHTLFFAQAVGPRGLVIAIEPQRAVYQLLCANLALNQIGNARPLLAGAGRAPGQAMIPAIDYARQGNFGGVALTADAGEPIGILTIDGLGLNRCHFIKIDVEGQEQAVIAGAAETIARFAPALYVENDRRANSAELIRHIRDLGYVLYWHLPPLYSAANFFGNATDVFPGIVSINMLCLPGKAAHNIVGLLPVAGPDHWPLT